MDRLRTLHRAGASVWLDTLSRRLLDDGFAACDRDDRQALSDLRNRARTAGSALDPVRSAA